MENNVNQYPIDPVTVSQPKPVNDVMLLAYSPNSKKPNNTYRLERGVIRLFNGKSVASTPQFKGSPLFGKVNSTVITKNPGVISAAAGGIVALGSIPRSIATPNYSFSAPNTTTLTITWTNYATRLVDGSSIILAAGSITITGLTAGTAYNYYPFYSVPSMSQGWVQGGVGNPAIAFTTISDAAANVQLFQQNISFGILFFTQPSSGTGSGTAGGLSGTGTGGGGRTHIIL